MAGSDDLLAQWKQEQSFTNPSVPMGGNPSDALVEQWKTEQNFQFSTSINNAVNYNPAQVAKNRRVAQSTGLPDDVVERNAQEAERMARINQIRQAAAKSPVLAQQLSDLEFAKLASTDADALADLDNKTRTIGGTLKDLGITATKAAISLPQTAVGLADLVTGGYAGKGVEAVGINFKKAQDILEDSYSGAQKEANRRVREAHGVTEVFKAALQNPSVVGNSILESLPTMMAGGVVARGLLGIGAKVATIGPSLPGTLARTFGEEVATAIAAGVGEGAMQAGSAAEQSRSESTSGLLNAKQTVGALASGTFDAAISFLGGRVAQKFGIADFDLLMAGGKGSKASTKHAARRALEGMATEGVLEELPQSIQEQMWQNWSDDKPLMEGVDQAAVLGMLSGMAMGGGANVTDVVSQHRAQKRFDQQAQVIDMLAATEQSELRKTAPEQFAGYMQKVGDEHGVSSVYLQVNKLVEAAAQHGVAEQDIPAYVAQYGVTPEQLTTALQTEGNVEMKLGEVARGYADDPILQSLQTEIKTDPRLIDLEKVGEQAGVEAEQLVHLDTLFQEAQDKKITSDDIAAWEEAILQTPGLKGKVTSEHLMPLIARANALAKLYPEMPAIEHLNRMLQSTGLQAMKFKEWEAQGKSGQVLGQVSTRQTLPSGQVHTHTNVPGLKNKEGYEAAKKAGDIESAISVVNSLVKPDVIAQLKSAVGSATDVVVVPVLQREGESPNALPLAYAHRIAKELGGTVWTDVVKVSGKHNTGSTGDERTRNKQVFEGEIPKGTIVVVDDTYTSGDTIASLVDHLGGNVAAVSTLAVSRYGKSHGATPEKISQMLDKIGVTEVQFTHEFGYPPELLTGAEVNQYLLNGARGIDGAKSRFPARMGEGFPRENQRPLVQSAPLFQSSTKSATLTPESEAAQGVEYATTEQPDQSVADLQGADGERVERIAPVEAAEQAGALDRARLPEQSIVTIKEAQDWLEAHGFPRIAPQSETADLISKLMENEDFQQLNIFDKIRVASQLERPIRKRDYNQNTTTKANRKLEGQQGNVRNGANQKVEGSGIVATDTIRGCDHFCFECYALKGSAQAAISHQHPILQELKGTIMDGGILRIGEVGDPSKNWAWTDQQVRKVIEASQKRGAKVDYSNSVFYITKLLNLNGFNPETARNLQVTLDPLMPAHMWRSMENILRLKSAHPDVNINVRIRSVATANAELNDAMQAAVDFANQFKLPIIETRMRFIRNSSLDLLELDRDKYYHAGNQWKLKNGVLEETGDQTIVCDKKGLGCPGCLGCAKTTRTMRAKNLKNQQKAFAATGAEGVSLAETAPIFDPTGGATFFQSDSQVDPRLTELLDRYDNQDGERVPWMSDEDFVDELEFLANDMDGKAASAIADAVDQYREDSEYDRELKGRGDTESSFEVLLDAARFAAKAGGELYQSATSTTPLAALSITDSGENLVTLFEKADKSSFLHETAHIFLNDLKYVSETLGVQTEEWNKVKEWLGVGEDGVISRDMHEKFAEHFEVYLKNGQAPTLELRNAFRKFKGWLTKIYESFTSPRAGQRDITVSPELADLFDRLLATEQEIQTAREQAALVAMLDDKLLNGSNFTPEQIEEYKRIVGQAEDSGKERIDKHKLIGRDDRLKGWKEVTEREARTVPVYGFQEWMAEEGINRESATQQFGKVPDSPVWKKDGADINVAVAENGKQFGYESAAAFIEDLRDSPTRSQWIQKRMAQLETEYDMQQDTEEAIRTASLRRQLEMESQWLAKQLEKKETAERRKAIVTPREAMRKWAEGVVAGRTIKQISNIGKLLAESKAHRVNAINLARKGDYEGALKSNEQARLTEALIAESYRAMKSWDKMQKSWAKISKWTNDNKSVKIGTRFRDQINRLMSQYGIADKEFDSEAPNLHAFVANLTTDDLDGMGTVLADWIGQQTGEFKGLNWSRLQDLNDALKYLYGHGREEVEGLKLSFGQRVADYADDIEARMADLKNKPELKSQATAIGRILNNVQRKYRKFFANTGILRYIAKRADGYTQTEIGPAEQLVQNIIAGMAKVNDHWEAISKQIEPDLKVLYKDGKTIYTDLPLPESMRQKGEVWTKEKVVAAMLNTGNDSNLQRLMDGYGLQPEIIYKMAAKLTVEEWQSIQNIWNTVNTLWPQIADTHERLNFFRPKKIDPRRMVVQAADGPVELDGGYYPIAYDKDKNRKSREYGEKDDILSSQEMILQKPVPKAGATKARAEKVDRPLNLSLSVLGQHFGDMIKYIHLSEVVRDADRVFRKQDLSTRMEEVMGQDVVDMIRPTLVNVLRPAPSDLGWFEKSRVAMSMYYMGYNAWTALQNITGVFPAIRQAGMQNYLNGIAHVIGNPLAAQKAMEEASAYMRLREANIERDMRKQLRDFSVAGMEINGKRYTYDDVKSLGFAAIRLIDGIVALPAWWGVYNNEISNHGDVKKATEAADAAINKALGSGLAIDSTGFGRHKFFSLMAPFMSFASTQQEVLASEREAWRQGKISTSEFLYGHFMTWLAPALMSTFMQGALMYGILGAVGAGGDDKKEKDAMDYATDAISYRLMGIPFVRDIYNAVLQGFEKKTPVTGARMPATEGFKMAQQFGYRIGNLDGSEKTTKAAMWSAAELASLSSGIPATRIYERWMKGQKNIEDGSGWWGNHFVPQEKKK